MACKIGIGEGGLEEVTFLYLLTSGSCPKSYGVNVARLAGSSQFICCAFVFFPLHLIYRISCGKQLTAAFFV
jgi:hypothetical protein